MLLKVCGFGSSSVLFFGGNVKEVGFFLEGGNWSVQIQRKLNEGGRWKGLVETHCGFGFCEWFSSGFVVMWVLCFNLVICNWEIFSAYMRILCENFVVVLKLGGSAISWGGWMGFYRIRVGSFLVRKSQFSFFLLQVNERVSCFRVDWSRGGHRDWWCRQQQ